MKQYTLNVQVSTIQKMQTIVSDSLKILNLHSELRIYCIIVSIKIIILIRIFLETKGQIKNEVFKKRLIETHM